WRAAICAIDWGVAICAIDWRVAICAIDDTAFTRVAVDARVALGAAIDTELASAVVQHPIACRQQSGKHDRGADDAQHSCRATLKTPFAGARPPDGERRGEPRAGRLPRAQGARAKARRTSRSALRPRR